MSALTIYSDKDASQHQWHSTDAAEIAQQLNAKGVRFERRLAQSVFAFADQREGANAFIEKRPAEYRHR